MSSKQTYHWMWEILHEREKQLKKWSPEHDAEHQYGSLAKAAACLAVNHTDARVEDPAGYSSEEDPWGLIKRYGDDEVRALVIAGALIIAELERMERRDNES